MISLILQAVSSFILFVIGKIGYLGIFFLMTLQSANIPVPSEIVMSFSGFLVGQGIFRFWFVVLAGAFGNLLGALISYQIAANLMKNGFFDKYRFFRFLVNPRSVELSDRWFKKYGPVSVFLGRMVPVISTFISFPAGLKKMKISTFASLTFLGSLIWGTILTWLGFALGENWETLKVYFQKFDYLILALILLTGGFLIKHRFFNEVALNRKLN